LEQIFLKKYIKTLGENALKFFQKSCTENPWKSLSTKEIKKT
jgi:hypothetical protein